MTDDVPHPPTPNSREDTLIERYWPQIGRIAAGLLEHRTLTGRQVRAYLEGVGTPR